MDAYIEQFKWLYNFLNHDMYTELRKVSPPQECNLATTFDETFKIAQRINLTDNVYIGLNSRGTGGRRDEHITQITTVFFDIDCKCKKPASLEYLKLMRPQLDYFLYNLNLFGYKHPVVIETGNGAHVLYKIRPLRNTKQNRDRLYIWGKNFQNQFNDVTNELNEKFRDVCFLDFSFSIGKSTKVPGTVVSETNGRVVNILNFNDVKDMQLKDMTSNIISDDILDIDIIKLNECATTVTANDTEINIMIIIKYDRKMLHLFNGCYNGYKSRSEAEMALVCKCTYYGLSDRQTDILMTQSKIGKWQTASASYKQRTISRARGTLLF